MIAWLEKQGTSYTNRDVDDAYLKGVRDTKNEIEKQYEANYQTRKDIATFIFNYRGDIKDRAKWMDYLGIKVSFVEKQGEQKVPVNDFKAKDWYVSKVDGKIHNIYHSVVKVEPKFHEGDWAVSNLDGKARQVSEVHFDEYNSYYVVDGKSVNLEEYDRLHHLWTIADAKDGDVLANDTIVLIFDHLGTFENRPIIYSWYFADSNKFYGMGPSEPDRWEVGGFHPATKEQRDFLFAKMKESGYEWDSEKKELVKIKNYDDKLREAICE